MTSVVSTARPAARHDALQDIAPALTLALGGLALVLGAVSATSVSFEAFPAPLLGLLGVVLVALLLQVRRVHGFWDRRLAIVAVLAFLLAVVLQVLPLYVTGLRVNGVLHRSLISSVFLLVVSVPSVMAGIYYFLGATPRAEDLSRYPLIVAPVAFVLAVYGLLFLRIVGDGLANANLDVFLTPYRILYWTEQVWIDGWPHWVNRSLSEVGMRNHILGTLLLMGLTAAMATPIGVSVGVFASEYGPPWLVRTIRTSTSLLRAVSPFVLGLIAVALIRQTSGTWLSDIFGGFYVTMSGVKRPAGGSFFLAAAVISILVIPVIARATEEGCRSLPRELREGSWALGASPAYTLGRIVLPWSLPNIVTGVLLACAEAGGDMAILMFMAGSGDYGVGVFQQVTSLAYLVYGAQYGVSKAFRSSMLPYQFTGAIVLLAVTVGLALAAMVVKSRFAKRYRGA